MPVIENVAGIRRRDDLTQAYHTWAPEGEVFIADQLASDFEVNAMAGTYGFVPAATYTIQLAGIRRAHNAAARTAGWSPSRQSFVLDTYAMVDTATEDDAKIYPEFEHDEIVIRRCATQIKRQKEIDVASIITSATLFPASGTTGLAISAGNEWSNANNADPIGNIQFAISQLRSAGRPVPDTLVINRFTWANLSKCNQIRERSVVSNYMGTAGAKEALLPGDLLAAALGVRRVLVSDVQYTPEGGVSRQAYPTNEAFLCKVSASRDLQTPGTLRTFRLRDSDVRIYSAPKFNPRGTEYLVEDDFSVHLHPEAAAFRFTNVSA